MIIGLDASRANRSKRSGIENYSLSLLRALALSDIPFSVRVYLDSDPISELMEFWDVFDIRVLKPSLLRSRLNKYLKIPLFWTHTVLSKELRENPVDLFIQPGHMLPFFQNTPSVAVIHDVAYRYVPSLYTYFDRWFQNFVAQRSLNIASDIVTVSEKTASDVRESFDFQKSIHVISPSLRKFYTSLASKQEIESVREKFSLDEDFFLTVSNVIPKKGLQRLLQGFAKYLAFTRDENTSLVIVGKGHESYIQKLRNVALRFGLRGRVFFLGYASDVDVRALYARARLVIVPSEYEGFGYPVIESLSQGTIPVVSDRGSLPEVARDHGEVFHFDEEGSLSRAIHDALLREENLDERIAFARSFSPLAMRNGYIKIIEKYIDKKRN